MWCSLQRVISLQPFDSAANRQTLTNFYYFHLFFSICYNWFCVNWFDLAHGIVLIRTSKPTKLSKNGATFSKFIQLIFISGENRKRSLADLTVIRFSATTNTLNFNEHTQTDWHTDKCHFAMSFVSIMEATNEDRMSKWRNVLRVSLLEMGPKDMTVHHIERVEPKTPCNSVGLVGGVLHEMNQP